MTIPSAEDFHIGWICALPVEMAAAKAMLDETYERLEGQAQKDHNSYVLGRIQNHNIAIACLPAGVDGLAAAATVARDMTRSLPAMRFGLMVGIGGGIPDLKNNVDVRLGDIVVSKPTGVNGGVIQYEKGKITGTSDSERTFIRKGFLNAPPSVLLHALSSLQAEHEMRDSRVPQYLSEMLQRYPKMAKNGYSFPGTQKDLLYCTYCLDGNSCDECHQTLVIRSPRDDNNPEIHYGVIASGDLVVKNSAVRNTLRECFEAKCVEMEAAGLMNNFPCLVIRGVCDYADSNKNDTWHRYAAATASAFAKELLHYVSAEETVREKAVQQRDLMKKQVQISREHLETSRMIHLDQERQRQHESTRECHQALRTSLYESFKNTIPERYPGTCKWVIDHPQYRQWCESYRDDLLWISADPGCGKSVLAKSLVDHELKSADSHTVCYFFFKDIDERNSLDTALCAILHQLFSCKPTLLRNTKDMWTKNGKMITSNVDQLWHILMEAASDPDKGKITCVLDALDECRQNDRLYLIDLLSKFYTKPRSSEANNGWLKFLVTSRPYQDVRDQFHDITSSVPTIHLRGEDENKNIRKEIDLVIHHRAPQMASKYKLSEKGCSDLSEKLLSMENRTYLWLDLALRSIATSFSNSYLPEKEPIVVLPASVEAAYQEVLDKVEVTQRDKVKLILGIVVSARRPLTIGEMAIALGLATAATIRSVSDLSIREDHLRDNIRQWCGLFLFFDDSRIYLIHQTAKEFLIRNVYEAIPSNGWKYSLDLTGVERTMAEVCIQLLSSEDLPKHLYLSDVPIHSAESGLKSTDPGLRHLEDFLRYSAEHWPSHVRNTGVKSDDPLIKQVLPLYDMKIELYHLWFPLFWHTLKGKIPRPKWTKIHLAAFLDHAMVLKTILQTSSLNLDALDDQGRTALIWAAIRGHLDIAVLLLEHGANVDAAGRFGTALHYASRRGNYEIVRLLLETKADVNASGKNGTVFQAALASDQTEIAKLLISYDVDLNMESTRGYPIQLAAEEGNIEILRVLLDKGLSPGPMGHFNDTPLHRAAQAGQFEMVKLLLATSVDMNAVNRGDSTPLLLAVDRGHLYIVEALLEHGAEVNLRSKAWSRKFRRSYAATPLHLAVEKGDHRMIHLLLKWKADLNALDSQFQTPLLVAVNTANVGLVKELLNYGSDVKAFSAEQLDSAILDGYHAENGRRNRAGDISRGSYQKMASIIKILRQEGLDMAEPKRPSRMLPELTRVVEY